SQPSYLQQQAYDTQPSYTTPPSSSTMIPANELQPYATSNDTPSDDPFESLRNDAS
ncbi:hypothetical protein Tco_1535775, partial [Tanacetum coccineum]